MPSAGKREAASGSRPRAAIPESDLKGMAVALAEARAAAAAQEVPVGAAVLEDGVVVARAHNATVGRRDPTAHAELLAIQQAVGHLKSDRLTGCTLYVTLEPCAQCAGAVVLAKVGRLVFGAYDPKAGMCGSQADLVRHPGLNHRVEVLGGVEADACGSLLVDFFQARR